MYSYRFTLSILLLGLFLATGCSSITPMGPVTEAAALSSATETPSISVNAEEEEEPTVWEGLVEAVAAASGGNTRTKDVDARIEVKATWEFDRFLAYARSEWGETEIEDANGNKSDERHRNRQTAGLKWEHDVTDRLYGFAKQDFEKDEFQDLRLRSTSALGSGYKILDEEKHKLDAEVGVGWEDNDYYASDDADNMVGTFGESWTWLIADDWKFVQTLSLVSNLQEVDDDFRTVATADLRHQLTSNLFLAFGFEHRYYAEPARERETVAPFRMIRKNRQDWLATFKLGWNF
jgi:putative salt-induced outer membrane protein